VATPAQKRRRGRLSLILGTLIAAAMVVSIAWADNVVNNVAAVPGSDTFTAGGSTSVSYQIVGTGGDGQGGCNASDGSAASVTINVPVGATVDTDAGTPGNQTGLSFTSCGTFKPATFTSTTPGDYVITVGVSDSGAGTYNLTPATFTLHVLAAADSTPPTLSLPANITAEATGSSGAVVTYSASASDLVDGAVPVNCTPVSGSTFALGTTTVDCSATDAHSNTANGSFTVTVQDITAPSLTLPSNITAEATGPTGAAVSYSASATDVVDGTVAVNCSPASGSTFVLGATTVDCSATDAHSNTANGSFTVTVQDTTAPSLTLPSNITAEATGPTGVAVSYSASATDIVDTSVDVNCTPVSGSTFALGTTTVNCSATDDASNTASGSFTVTVQDTTAPSLTLPANFAVAATSISGAVVTYSASASDLVDGSVAVTCSPASGSTFGPGTTTVNCSAMDTAGNTGHGSFTVTVKFAASGFYQPVDMTPPSAPIVWNTVKNGSTVPLKFEVFAGSTELTSIAAVNQPLKATGLDCLAGNSDEIELTATGGTSLRYDTTGGQFIYNWQTPKKMGACYLVTVSMIDGSSLSSYFELK
jgi:hypothetical protein